jgi:hypothetical protein
MGSHRQALALHYVDALRQHVEQQVADAVVQKVQLVDVQDATVGLRQKAAGRDQRTKIQ